MLLLPFLNVKANNLDDKMKLPAFQAQLTFSNARDDAAGDENVLHCGGGGGGNKNGDKNKNKIISVGGFGVLEELK